MTVKPLTSEHNELITHFGAVVYRWAYVEFYLGDFLSYMMSADQGRMHIISKSISNSTVVDWLKLLAPYQFTHPETQTALKDLFERVDAVRAERNAYVHGLWSAGPVPATADVMTIRWDRAEIMKRELVTLDDLKNLLDDIGRIQAELSDLGNKLGFHPTAVQPKQPPDLKG